VRSILHPFAWPRMYAKEVRDKTDGNAFLKLV
jgi:hypothetical protein